jgi:lipopolysaccharide transport system ATP-binding protein
MYVRLAFAVGAHLEPEVLIVDEVLAVGDVQFQKKCLDKMHDIGQHGRTVLFVSHNMQAITRLCQRALLLEKGRVIADGAAHRVVGAYLHSGFGSQGSTEWPDIETAPGDATVRLRAVRVRALDGRVTDMVDIRQDFAVEVEIEVLQSGRILIPNIVLTNDEGLDLFEAFDLDPDWRGVPRPIGHYTCSAWIPGNLLSEGTFFASAACISLDPHTEYFYEREVAAFQVVDGLHGDSARGDFTGNMIGAVRPLLKWTTQYTPNV